MTPKEHRWMNTSKTMEQTFSNFITPPDFVDNANPSVLLIDASWDDVETIALWCQNANDCYNVYMYSDIMLDEQWLNEAITRVDAIVLNTEKSDCTQIKNTLIKDARTWYYGPSRYLGNPRQLGAPLEFFIKYNERNN